MFSLNSTGGELSGRTDLRVSVVTSAYRSERYLSTFLSNVLEQTRFSDLELVVALNDPSEQELTTLASYEERFEGRLRFSAAPRETFSASINRAIALTSAAAIAIWNVDDIRTPDSLELQLAEIDLGASLVYGDYWVVKSYGSRADPQLVDTSRYRRNQFFRGMLLGPFMMFSRAVLSEAGPFDEQFQVGADFDFALRAIRFGEARRTSGALGYYLDEGSGLSTNRQGLQPAERVAIQLRYRLFEDVDYLLLPAALEYDIANIHVAEDRLPVKDFLGPTTGRKPEREERAVMRGMRRQQLRSMRRPLERLVTLVRGRGAREGSGGSA